MSGFTEIFSAAAQLPIEERVRLIDELAETIPCTEELLLSPEWLAEIERRSADIDAGTAEFVDWEVVREKLYNRVNLRRAD